MTIKIRTQGYGWIEIDVPNELIELLKTLALKERDK